MEKKFLIISLVSLIVIANAIVTPVAVGIDDQENILSKLQTTLITPVSIVIDNQDNILKYVQCYGYYGC